MEVTKTNFEKLYPEIEKDIENATFLSIDGEFTGLNNGPNVTAFDTPSEYYSKIISGSLDFLFVQFGLSIFTQDENTGRYKNKSYVFYLFPRPLNRLAPDIRFLCQASSIDFLISNNFDFNKLFREGIPYLNGSDEASLGEAMETKRHYQAAVIKETNSGNSTIPIPKQLKPLIDGAMKKIAIFIEGSNSEMKIEKCSAFVRKLIYQTFQETYKDPGEISLSSENGVMYCRREAKDVVKKQQEKEEKDAEELAAAVGFSKVIRAISSKGKLVIGHNMLLDVCHLVHRFLDPLPSDYHMFKEMVHCLFPKLIDTKYICSEEPLKSLITTSTLEGLVDTIKQSPFHLPSIDGEEGYSYQLSETKYHDAGYDAFVTGACFLSFIRSIDPDNKVARINNCKPLERYMNKLYLMKAPDTCIDLVNADPEPSRDHVFHISFPKHWNNQHIGKLFSAFGGVQTWWLSDTTAWASLYQRSEHQRVLRQLVGSQLPTGVKVISYQSFMKEKGAASSPRPNKRKSRGSMEASLPESGKRRRSTGSHLHSSDTKNNRRISPIKEETNDKEPEVKKTEVDSISAEGEFSLNEDWT